jgi:bacteriocin-like protein
VDYRLSRSAIASGTATQAAQIKKENAMTTSKKGQEKSSPAPKKPAGIRAEIDKGKAELSDDELKKVTGGSSSQKRIIIS